ncbi:hypothetical protein GCM10023264_23690 [Sphingomonas daechungensis]|uniref:hypothetical protein n=1 Tax=Sphingomonas daechungensis TaxID=1176646 RepID=UPI001CB95D12|nr:hypothetical protein [Sphingomonas daechungensis]
MIRFILPIVAISSILSMVACSGRDPVDDGANNAAAGPAEVDVLPPDESATTPTNELESGDDEPSNASAAVGGKIPAALHGRWGLTPTDCTSTRGDAKGLLIVSADQLKFYESTGKPSGELKTSDDSASGDFAFTGEGMTWKRYEALEVQAGKLVRTESSPMRSFTYARCEG